MPEPPAGVFLHETAVVEDGAEIAGGTSVWHHAHVRAGARIGRDCVLGKGVFVDGGVHIGDGVHVQNYVSVYRGVVLEAEVFVGPSAVFTNDRLPRAANASWEPVQTVVRRGSSIGANATVICGIELGPWSMVGAGSVVTRTVAANELVAGNPARRRGWVCRCGEILASTTGPLTRLACRRCGEVWGG